MPTYIFLVGITWARSPYWFVKTVLHQYLYALGENRTHILSFGGLRAIRCTTRALSTVNNEATRFIILMMSIESKFFFIGVIFDLH